jgi:hypothetical protein
MQFVMLAGRPESSTNQGRAGMLVISKCVGQINKSAIDFDRFVPLAILAVPPGIQF